MAVTVEDGLGIGRGDGPAATFRRGPALRRAIARVAGAVGTLLVVSVLVFIAVTVLPGDVVDAVLGTSATPERVAAVRESLHLTDPLAQRYLAWLGGILRGDLGESTAALAQGQHLPVAEAIRGPIANSLVIAGLTLALFVPLSLLLGTLAARREGSFLDRGTSVGTLTLTAMPEFLVGTLLILVFFRWLDWLPPTSMLDEGASPWSDPAALVLPVMTLVLSCLAFGARLVRAAMLDALHGPVVAAARLNGLSERAVLVHALRNAAAPMLQALALVTRYLLGGIVVVESIFSYPGIGIRLLTAVQGRDIQIISVVVLLLAAIYIGINTLVDVLILKLVPRSREVRA